MPTRHKATRGPWNGCTWGNPYHKLDWQGGLLSIPSTCASEKLKGNHNASGTRAGNCLYMRVSNCSGIKRIRTWNTNIAGMKGETIQQKKKKRKENPHNHWEIEAGSGATHCKWSGCWEIACFSWRATPFHPSSSQVTSVHLNMEDGNPLRIRWSMKVKNLFRPLLVKFFLTCEKNITKLER